MSKFLFHGSADSDSGVKLETPLERRTFLRYTGLGMAVGGLALAGCNNLLEDDLKVASSATANDATLVDVGSDDLGILNYAYALEQLEAAFYARVLMGRFYNSTSAPIRVALQGIEAHERIHREFLKKAIMAIGATPLKDLEPDFSTINFDSQQSVLAAAKAFEDLGVAAYNGAGKLIKSPDYLTIAGKIVSVEARHAALIRDFVEYNTFVGPDVVDLNTGLEKSRTPAEVVAIANNFLMPGSKLSVANLPTA